MGGVDRVGHVRGRGVVWQSPAIRSWYTPRDSLRGLFRQYFQYGYWKVRIMQKHGRPAAWRHLAPAALVLTVLSLGVGSVLLPPARWLLGTVLLAYAVALGLGTLDLARRDGGREAVATLPQSLPIRFGLGLIRARELADAVRGWMAERPEEIAA